VTIDIEHSTGERDAFASFVEIVVSNRGEREHQHLDDVTDRQGCLG
jgi:hypothetical protein